MFTRRKTLRAFFVSGAALAMAQPAKRAQALIRFPLRVESVQGLCTKTGLFRLLQVGDPIRQKDLVKTGENSILRLSIDYRQGYVVVSESTLFELYSLRGDWGAAQTILVLRTGQLYHGLRDFSSPYSRFEIYDYQRSRVVRVTGTEFSVSVAEEDGPLILGVKEGGADLESNAKTVEIPGGMASRAEKGKPPTEPAPVDTDMNILVKEQSLTASSVTLDITTDRLNTIIFAGKKYVPSENGLVTLKAPRYLWGTNQIQVIVQNAIGDTRAHKVRLSLKTENLEGEEA